VGCYFLLAGIAPTVKNFVVSECFSSSLTLLTNFHQTWPNQVWFKITHFTGYMYANYLA